MGRYYPVDLNICPFRVLLFSARQFRALLLLDPSFVSDRRSVLRHRPYLRADIDNTFEGSGSEYDSDVCSFRADRWCR